MKTATSFMPAVDRRVQPLPVGHQRRVDDAPACARSARDTSPPSASCGIHFGFTKLVISMARSPVSDSASMSFTLSSVGTMRDSFCRPSRGPTSYIVTSGGSCSNTAGILPRASRPPAARRRRPACARPRLLILRAASCRSGRACARSSGPPMRPIASSRPMSMRPFTSSSSCTCHSRISPMITAVPARPTSTMRSSRHSMATGASTIRGGATLSHGTLRQARLGELVRAVGKLARRSRSSAAPARR